MRRKKIFVLSIFIIMLSISIMSFTNNSKNETNLKFDYTNATANIKKVLIDDGTYTDRIPILTFHRLVPNKIKNRYYKDNEWVGSIDTFEEMMEYLYDNGYKTISTEEFYDWYTGKVEYDKKTVLICFDDGFYEDYYLAYPILKKYDFKATSFVVGSRIEETTHKYMSDKKSYKKNTTYYIGQDVIDEVREEYPNYEFQSHSYNYHYYTKDGKHRIHSMSYEELVDDVDSMAKYKFSAHAYPYGQYNEIIQKVLKEKGYLVAFRFGPSDYAKRDNDQYAIYRIKINGDATLKTLKKWLNY